MIIKLEIARSINMSHNLGVCVNILDLDASADEMPFVAELTENVRSFAANYPQPKEKASTP